MSNKMRLIMHIRKKTKTGISSVQVCENCQFCGAWLQCKSKILKDIKIWNVLTLCELWMNLWTRKKIYGPRILGTDDSSICIRIKGQMVHAYVLVSRSQSESLWLDHESRMIQWETPTVTPAQGNRDYNKLGDTVPNTKWQMLANIWHMTRNNTSGNKY